VEAPQVQTTFAALRMIVSADSVGQLVLQKPGQDYLVQVQGLAQAVGLLTQDPAQAAVAVQTAASQGEAFVRQTEITFPQEPPPARQANAALVALLQSPFSLGRELSGRGPGIAANLKSQNFCSRWTPLVFQKFPFRRDATDEVAMADLHTLFNPASGELTTFLRDVDGSEITPTPAYSTFRSRALEIASALYEAGPAAPGLRFALQVRSIAGIDRVDVRVDGQTRAFTATEADRQSFTWDGARANTVSVVVRQGARPTTLEYAGPWALFRLFSVAGGWQDVGGQRYVVTWPVEGTNLAMDVYFTRVPVLNPAYLAVTCPRQVAR
jgi:type VI protein secretion system component VasK